MAEVWTYDDYEFDNRVVNLMWTVCGDYTEEMSSEEKTALSKNAALYYGITAGSRRRFVDWEIAERYVAARSRQGFNANRLKRLVIQAAGLMATHKLSIERPGILDIEREACAEIVTVMEKPLTDSVMDQIEFAVTAQLGGVCANVMQEARNISQEILVLRNASTMRELLAGVDALYIAWQKVAVPPFSEVLLADASTVKSELAEMAEDVVRQLLEKSKKNNGSLEQQENTGGTVAAAEVVLMDAEEIENMHRQVAHYCGASYLPERINKKIQARLCKGVHRDCYLHYTDGVLRSKEAGDYQKKFALKDKNRNISAWEANQRVYQQMVKRLRDGLLRTLVAEREKNPVLSDFGNIAARRVWRIGRTAATRVFERFESNDKGNFVVDLMLDASTSQKGRESAVAIQAYIIAEALIEAGIPCRVTGFNCFLDFTVLKRFRDYDDPAATTANIFEYYCEGSNRDGLAVKGVLDALYQREEENKILIVLSDGKPNDIHLVKKDEKRPFRGETAYTGGLAVGDTAKEIRIARTRGISVLGVFTGAEQELEAEKHIYGKDFIYTRDVRRFEDIVTTYLKRIITQ